ncbi:BZ3500_MvSof-1268-A1-R1_Chr12-3g04059 [Microbotryum saponariae]|uniref:BZ3500_MvSof-1268-A1-R1_Chr12-3g04059 protein n=1 Tax=Microbotryum saponariae TaxID=289078 RepID=A0A2X0KP55_9BASI|nr:BZ3500_MvSof-1268-A1-R1_Chr12-3g04059 [Microbotryum saponariae]SDA02617.1 BZ3501_MvSof-1269-A2-R1_Chr12-3g03714 [Microbotryum saponariae]
MSQIYVPEKEDERHEEAYHDVVKEEISSSSTPREIDLSAEEELDARRRARRNERWYISLGGVILVLLILLGVMLGLVKGQEKRWESVIEEQQRHGAIKSSASAVRRGRWAKRNERSEYSFSTKNGTVATYIYTTKPIVNPGGYTIGTLTGYVTYTGKPFSTTASAAPAATSSSAPTSISTLTSTKPTDSTHEESTSSTEAEGHSHPSNTNTASPTRKEHHSAPTPTDPPTIADSLLHLLVNGPKRLKRSLDQDAQEQLLEQGTPSVPPNTVTTVPDQDGREYSYSVRKDGGTATFVKTTRPIVNPAGYTIGTLDGVFVELKTTRPRSTGTAERGGVKNPKVHQPVVRSREELRKRASVDFGVGMQL